jgi:hypothetical protein
MEWNHTSGEEFILLRVPRTRSFIIIIIMKERQKKIGKAGIFSDPEHNLDS